MAQTNQTFSESERPYYYHSNHLGSSAWITNYLGTPVQSITYLPYGKVFINQQSTTYDAVYKFIGKERDSETGYDLLDNRYYSSDLGMFISTDPLAHLRSWMTPYNYSQNSPIMRIDPTGLSDESITKDPPSSGIPPNFKGCLINDNRSDYARGNTLTPTPASNNSQVTQNTNDVISTAGTALSTGSATAGVAGEVAEGSDATFRLTNSKGKFDPKLYSNGWKGNQYITPNSLSKIGKGIKWGGNIMGGLSAAISFIQIINEPTTLGKIGHGVDGGMSIVGMFGPYGLAASLYYSGVLKNYPAIKTSVNQQSIDRANMMQRGFIPVGHPGLPFK